MIRLLRNTLLTLLLTIALLWTLASHLSWQPAPREDLPVSCTASSTPLVPGQALKVMTWNVQYLAGKRYVFWYDEGRGSDTRPTAEDLAHNLDEVARVIRAEQPDIVLLQELDNNAKATGYHDQLALLRERLVDLYPCAVQAYDWKAEFVPDWHVFGSVGRSLATLSRYPISKAQRLQLPTTASNALSRLLQPQHAVLASYLPLRDGGQLAVLNTRLAHYETQNDVQRQQVQALVKQLGSLERQGAAWLIGGDFNMLPLGQYRRLTPQQRGLYAADSDLHLLWDTYPMIPSNAEASGADRARWLTHYPNDPNVSAPDRTLDYLFHSPKLTRVSAQVLQQDTLEISDHLPVSARLLLPVAP
ncbi:endonuclease/exonuclease/phosphatase family protein [Pseudomonas defluvii]|jgi:endonuclease/exonuclease/phosphatase family metal-dependent hydrolase|uniref:endonuclease/exonuclease/phosphatase family protein n=1 Tax=Pseudomonas TaxID=286 RepID=UPI0008119F8C|nr:endonuclease/exonuclease/phosphatase family protein [Pseudomonas defluvii]MEE3634528.1 endonuclease/exonuclease/phosphatase family protein [Pseudomonas sp. AL 58]WJM96896.1 endonuclease/exonuclease/phosphatase family protein [Pseudomonas defluvii]